MNNETYSKLCEIGIHAMPDSANLSHQFDSKTYDRSRVFNFCYTFNIFGKEYVWQHYFLNLSAGKYEAYPNGRRDNPISNRKEQEKLQDLYSKQCRTCKLITEIDKRYSAL